MTLSTPEIACTTLLWYKGYIMYTVTYKCVICHFKLVRDFPDMEIWDVEFVVNDDELGIASGEMYCPECGQICPVRITIYDDVSCEVVSEKIISPMHYDNCDIWDDVDSKRIECDLCKGNGSIEIAKKSHIKEDMLFIDSGNCPLCMGKGYLEEKE